MIPLNINKDHILKAIEEINKNGYDKRHKSTKFDLYYNNKTYPPKVIIEFANRIANPYKPLNYFFSGGNEANNFLRNLGFKIKEKSSAYNIIEDKIIDVAEECIEEKMLHINTPSILEKETMLPTVEYFKAKKVDFEEIEQSNKEIGLNGEEFILEYEKKELIKKGLNELAEKITHTSLIEGDGAGYDIKSYTPDGDIKYIEVKTTSGVKDTIFFLSINELKFSQKYSENYYLYRVYEFNKEVKYGKLHIIKGDLNRHFNLEPIKFKAKPKSYY